MSRTEAGGCGEVKDLDCAIKQKLHMSHGQISGKPKRTWILFQGFGRDHNIVPKGSHSRPIPRPSSILGLTTHNTGRSSHTVEAGMLEHGRPPTPNKRKKENQHNSPYVHVPTFWSLLYYIPCAIYYILHSIYHTLYTMRYIQTYMCIYIYVHIYIYIHIHICIYT